MVDFRAPAVKDFLLHLFEDRKFQPSTIDGYRSAIAKEARMLVKMKALLGFWRAFIQTIQKVIEESLHEISPWFYTRKQSERLLWAPQ